MPSRPRSKKRVPQRKQALDLEGALDWATSTERRTGRFQVPSAVSAVRAAGSIPLFGFVDRRVPTLKGCNRQYLLTSNSDWTGRPYPRTICGLSVLGRHAAARASWQRVAC
jgi:hypothetical protein